MMIVFLLLYLALLVAHFHYTKYGVRIVTCRWFPPKGFKAIMLFWWLIVKKGCNVTSVLLRHEQIHVQQQSEMLLIPFFLWYGVEFVFRLCQYREWRLAYKNISFEREAYANEKNVEYLNERAPYAWIKHLKKDNLI